MLPTELINQSSSKVNHSISCRFRQVILPGTRINSPHFCESLNQLSGKYKYLLIADELKFNAPLHSPTICIFSLTNPAPNWFNSGYASD